MKTGQCGSGQGDGGRGHRAVDVERMCCEYVCMLCEMCEYACKCVCEYVSM